MAVYQFKNVSPTTTKRDFLVKHLPHLARACVAGDVDVHGSIFNAFPGIDVKDAEDHVVAVLAAIDCALNKLLGLGLRSGSKSVVVDDYAPRFDGIYGLIDHVAGLVPPPTSLSADGFVARFVSRLTGRIASVYREKWALDDLYAEVDERWESAGRVHSCAGLYVQIEEALSRVRKFDAIPALYEAMWALIKKPPASSPKVDVKTYFDVLPDINDDLALFASGLLDVSSHPPLSVFARKAGLLDVLRKAGKPVSEKEDTAALYDEKVRELAKDCVEKKRFDIKEVRESFDGAKSTGVLARAVYDIYCEASVALGIEPDAMEDKEFYGGGGVTEVLPPRWYVTPYVSGKILAAVAQCRDLVLRFSGTATITDAWIRKLVSFATTHDDVRAVAREYKRIQKRMAECLADEDDDEARSVFSRA